jgi:hypothetical protein
VIKVITVNIGARPSLRKTWRNWFLNEFISLVSWQSRFFPAQRFPGATVGTFAAALSSENIRRRGKRMR